MITTEQIDRIIRFHGAGLPVVSAYVAVPADPRDRAGVRSRLGSLVHEIRPLAKDDSLERDARMSLRGDIERLEHLEEEKPPRPGTLAVFSCSGRQLFEQVELPRTMLRDRIVVDETPWVRPMLAVLDEYHRYCIAIIEKGSAQVWELYQDEMRKAAKLSGPTVRKPNYATNLAEDRVRNRADELAKRHFRKVAELLDEEFRSQGYDLLIVGGHQHEFDTFVNFLSRDLQDRLAGTFTCDPDTVTKGDIRGFADAIVERYEYDLQRRWVAEIVEKHAAGGLAVLGLEPCLWAGSVAAINTLLVEEGAQAPGVVCDRDGWLARSGEVCPLCGNETRHTPDVIDELVQAMIDESGSIKHIRADTELKEHFVGASLRFPLPPQPDS